MNKNNSLNLNLFHSGKISPEYNYYSANSVNPYLRQFVELYMNDSEPQDISEQPQSQTVKKNGSLYDVHSYWSKKPYLAIERFILHYSRPGDIVLDPFAGCGSTLQAALGTGRKALGIDLSPSASHISAQTPLYVNPSQFEAIASQIIKDVFDELHEIYTFEYENTKFIISSLIHTETVRCIKCFNFFPLLIQGSTQTSKNCPHCGEGFSTRSRNIEFGTDLIVGVELRNSLDSNRGNLIWENSKTDFANQISINKQLIEKLKSIREAFNYKMPQRLLDLGGRLNTSGSTTIGKLFDDRALLTLRSLQERIGLVEDLHIRQKLLLAFTATLKNCSKMYRFHEGGGGSPIGAYYVPPIRKELNPLFAFKDKIKTILSSLKEISQWEEHAYIVSNQSSGVLDVPSNSIDYIFTDPPYADTMPYGALNFIWDSWLVSNWDWSEGEAIGSSWHSVMVEVFTEAFRVLKPGGYCSVCYHDTSEGTWLNLMDIMAEAGFVIESNDEVLYIETTQRSYQQTVADKVTKRDLVINFRKPKLGETTQAVLITGEEDSTTFTEKVHQIVRDYLTANPGATKDRIYDEVVSFMVRAGQMEAHNFDEILSQIAEPVRESENGETGASVSRTAEAGRWYLKETEAAAIDQAESVKEDRAAANIGDFIKQYLADRRGTEGVHYSDIFEQYVYTVKDKPRRQLADWLPDYFYKTDAGTYRLPATNEEEQLKQESRASGANRRIKRYLSYIQQGLLIPDKERPNDTTLAEWIRMSKRSGMYEAGKLLYEKGGLNLDNLPETTMVNVEEDYETCVRMLARNAAPPKAKRKSIKDS